MALGQASLPSHLCTSTQWPGGHPDPGGASGIISEPSSALPPRRSLRGWSSLLTMFEGTTLFKELPKQTVSPVCENLVFVALETNKSHNLFEADSHERGCMDVSD